MPTGYEKPTITSLYGAQTVEPELIALVVGPVAAAAAVAVLVAGAIVGAVVVTGAGAVHVLEVVVGM